MSNANEIRFIDFHYNELFRIPDGGSIVVTRPDGEEWVGICKYLDDCHFDVNGECMHIYQFAEIMQRVRASYMPEASPEINAGYRIMRRHFAGGKVFKLGHNPDAVMPYVTWQSYHYKNILPRLDSVDTRLTR